jgi:hypothetical protein
MADTELAGLPVKQLLATPGVSPTLAKSIQEADTDGNGVLSVAEVFEVFRKERQMDSERRLFRRITIALAVLLVLLVASLTGIVYGIVFSAKDTGVNSSNALVSKSTGQTLRTSPGALSLGDVVYNNTASAAYANASAATAQQLLQSGLSSQLQYAGDISLEAIVNGCELLLDGIRSFTAFEGTGEYVAVTTVNVTSLNAASCQRATSTGNATGLSALVTYEGNLYYVHCVDSSGTCQAFYVLNATTGNLNTTSPAPTNSSASGAGRRRLQSSAFPDDSLQISFYSGEIVQCSAAGCEDVSELVNPGRRLR